MPVRFKTSMAIGHRQPNPGLTGPKLHLPGRLCCQRSPCRICRGLPCNEKLCQLLIMGQMSHRIKRFCTVMRIVLTVIDWR